MRWHHSKFGQKTGKFASCGENRGRSLQSGLSEQGSRVCLLSIILTGLISIQNAAIAQGAASNVTQGEVLKSCDLAAASPYDKQRPPDVPGVYASAFDPKVAISACEAAARVAPRDARMLFELGRAYEAAKRFSEALMLYRQAAQMGNALAANDLALMYAKGEGVEVDQKAEAYYLDQAARAGLSIAQSNLGIRYLFGNNAVPKDESIARQLLYLAAKDNFPQAMYNLGLMLDKGVGGPQDSYGARKWIEKAANANDPGAISELAWMFQKGRGGPKDLDEARRLYKKAIAMGETKYAVKYLAELDRINPATAQGAPVATEAPVDGPAPPSPIAKATAFVIVELQPNASEEEVKAFLQAYNVTMVEQPNAEGFCKLRLPQPLPADQLQMFLDSIRTQIRIVRSAASG